MNFCLFILILAAHLSRDICAIPLGFRSPLALGAIGSMFESVVLALIAL
jgi:hypothetical protein